MKKLSLTVLGIIFAVAGFAQVNCSSLIASFTLSQSGNTVSCYNTSTNGTPFFLNSNPTWDFGDGSPIVTWNWTPTHTYTTPGTYTITLIHEWLDSMTNNLVCTDTAYQQVTITGSNPSTNEISGSVAYDSLFTTAPLSFKIWLIREGYDSSLMSITLTAVDSITTASQLYWANYTFNNHPAGVYYTKARVAPNTTNPGLIPTYHMSDAYWNTATQIVHSGGVTNNKHIWMISGTPTSGPGFVGGAVTQGAGKGTSTGIPDLLILLRDANNNFVASTYTDANGDYSFTGVPNGSYTIYPEEMSYLTTPSSLITIAAGQTSYTTMDFEKNSTSIYPASLSVADVRKNSIFGVYPNPAKDHLNISWKDGIKGDAQVVITDISGRIVYTGSVSTKTVAQISLSGLNTGVYFVKVNTVKGQYTERVILQ